MEALDVLTGALDRSQDELVQAELALTEATARAEAAREDEARLRAAVAALSGEPPPAAIPTETTPPTPLESSAPAGALPSQTPVNPDRADIHEMTPEEFDAERKRRQRQKQKEEQANNPYAHIKCSGCGRNGTMQDVVMQAPSGAPVRMMTCSSCGNQNIQ